MVTAILHARTLSAAVGAALAACLFCRPASAADNVQVVPVYSDVRGNGAWVEFEKAGERGKATPFVAVNEDGLKKLLEHPDEKGRLALPVPRLMRLVERARKAIRGMTRSGANAPPCQGASPAAAPVSAAAAPATPAGAAAPGTGPGDGPPDRTGSSAPPVVADPDIPAPGTFHTATR